MTYSLLLKNGDLVKGHGNSLATVEGASKVTQDLRLWLLEPLGTNPMHKDYGSLLNGDEDTFHTIGQESVFVSSEPLERVVSEIDRIVQAYMQQQLARMEAELVFYDGRHTFNAGEIIKDYSLNYEQIADQLYVDILLTMQDDTTESLVLPIETPR
jgi:hypothetical protein